MPSFYSRKQRSSEMYEPHGHSLVSRPLVIWCLLSGAYLVVRIRGVIRPARFEMLTLTAEQFQFAPVLQFGPEVFFCHDREFLMSRLPIAPVRGIRIPSA